PPPAPIETVAPVPPPTETTAVPTTVAEVPTTPAPTTTVAATTTTTSSRTERELAADASRELAEDAETLPSRSTVDYGNVLTWTLGGGFAVVVVLLALGGAALGGWALVAT